MQRSMKAPIVMLLMITMFVVVGCNKQDDKDVRVTTYTPQDIKQTTAKCGGDVVVTQGLSLDELGVCWSTKRNPTVEDSHLSTTNWNDTYVCTITGLEPSTKYHVRAYALRGLEYYYGDDKNFTTKEISGDGNGTYNGHEYVDLDLPSGILWATCNVGANTSEGYGDYFAWGETTPMTINSNLNYGYTIPHTLPPEYDAATVNWGTGWRMPTLNEWNELLDNTTVIWTSQNGVNGRRFTSSNGYSLFLPAAGSTATPADRGIGLYWSSSYSPYGNTGLSAWHFWFSKGNYHMSTTDRYYIESVRPVRSAQ